MTEETESLEVGPNDAGQRLDVFLAQRIEPLTRSQAERLAKSGRVRVNGRPAAAGHRVVAGEHVDVSLPSAPPERPQAEEIPLAILFEDEHIIVVNKPRGMVVHPAGGRHSGTLVNALLSHARTLASGAGPHRPGIVHRLDRDTSGLLVVAKTDEAYTHLSGQVRRRELERHYLALVWGRIREDRLLIDVPIGRHPRDGTRMAAVPRPSDGRKVRSARTDVIVLDRLGPVTLVEARLGTGRTHQIRVHLAHQGHPVVGDPAYGLRRSRRERVALDSAARELLRGLRGQALHAHLLRLRHPVGGQELTFTAPLPAEMAALVSHLSATGRRAELRQGGQK
jgi:23S rRNA pseudouridine1911/1915/1917 synthase